MGLTKNLGALPKVLTVSGSNIGVGTATPNEKLSVKASDAAIKLEGATNSYLFQIVDSNNRLRIFDNTNNAERITLTTGGNVGVGTTSIFGEGDSTRKVLSINGSSDAMFNIGINGTYTGVFYASATQTVLGSYANLPTNIVTNNTPRITVLSGGNVGIGTTSPDPFKLAVNGVVGINGTLGDTLGSLYIDHSGVQSWKIGVTTANTSTLSIGNDVGGAFVNKIMNFTNAGNVGIGTITPTTQLHIAKGGSTYITIDNTGSDYTTLIGSTGSGTKFYSRVLSTSGAAPMDFVVGSDSAIYINASRNVGIGTTSPGTKLTVAGGVEATSLSLQGNYNATVATDSSWSSYQNLISPGTLSPYKTYIISIWWHFKAGSNQPYYYNCAFLWQGASTNGTGTDNEFTPIGATHTGGTGATMSFRSIGAASSTTGIQARLNGFPTTGGDIYVRATIMQGF